MTILADMNSIFTNVLLVVHVAVCLLLCLVVLMQRPKQEGLGAAFGGGMTDQAFGARTTDVLQKGTVYLGTLLFIITLALAVLVSAKSKSAGVDEKMANQNKEQVDQADLPPVDVANKENEAINASAEGDKADKPSDPAKAPAEEKPEGEKPAETPSEDKGEKPEGAARETATGAIIGAAAGGLVGKQDGKPLGGTAIGAAAGGVIGHQVGAGEPAAEEPKEPTKEPKKEETSEQP